MSKQAAKHHKKASEHFAKAAHHHGEAAKNNRPAITEGGTPCFYSKRLRSSRHRARSRGKEGLR